MEAKQVKWEYKVLYLTYYTTEEDLNVIGDDGWELVLRHHDKYVFKRPKFDNN